MNEISDKITFGLKPNDIKVIEENLAKFGNKYHTWVEIGKTISWEPLTACCYYQKYQNQIINEIVGKENPFSLKDVLDKLIEASNILLLEKDYDGHGWELINSARDRASEISNILGTKFLNL